MDILLVLAIRIITVSNLVLFEQIDRIFPLLLLGVQRYYRQRREQFLHHVALQVDLLVIYGLSALVIVRHAHSATCEVVKVNIFLPLRLLLDCISPAIIFGTGVLQLGFAAERHLSAEQILFGLF